MRILIVEDDIATARSVGDALSAAGQTPCAVGSAEAARSALNTEPFDLAIVDVGLPGASGLDLLAWLRRGRNRVPVLILTARDGVADRVAALDGGADDYMIKPFESTELVARCRALIRRAQGAQSNDLRIGTLALHLADRIASIDDRTLALTRAEWALLERLALHCGRVVDKDSLRAAIAREDAETTAHALEAQVSRLRAKLAPDVSISTLRGLGYRLDDPDA